MNEFCLKQVQGLKTSAAHLNPNFPHCPPPPYGMHKQPPCYLTSKFCIVRSVYKFLISFCVNEVLTCNQVNEVPRIRMMLE